MKENNYMTAKPRFTEGQLPILVSTRIRLNDEERSEIKSAYRSATAREDYQELHEALGMSSMVFRDLINGRQTIALPLLVTIQNVLDLEIISHTRLMNACTGYIDYILNRTSKKKYSNIH